VIVKRISDESFGDLGVIEFANLSFVCQRAYWITNFVQGNSRGNHAHKTLTQFVIVLSGSVTFELFRGKAREVVVLTANDGGILIHPGTWRKFYSHISSSVVMVLCNQEYREEDYIRKWDEYQDWFSINYES
jgi:dTDP-4-dehydrorhamnose 3,5-epimerase-like enzyme